jgi:ABC-2 type transport system ATP-binding protein
MEVLIEADELFKSFGRPGSEDRIEAVRGVSLQVSRGEIYGLVGPDGAGKTTFLRMLCGALKPDHGSVRISGFDLPGQVEKARETIGYLAQRFSLYEDLTVLENIRFFAELRGLKPAEWRPRCMEILEFVDLVDFVDRRAGQLSGGMKQKLGLAAAMVHNPQVMLLDEPTTGVDPGTRQDFWLLVLRLIRDRGVAVLVSTPYMDEASRCTRVGFMKTGRLLVEDQPDVIRKRLSGRILELVGQPLPVLRRLAALDPGVEDVQMFGDRLHIRLLEGQQTQVLARLNEKLRGAGFEITRIRPVEPQLEDAFIDLVEKSA